MAGRLEDAARRAEAGEVLPPAPPWEEDLNAPVRVAVDYLDAEDLIAKVPKALKELSRGAQRCLVGVTGARWCFR